jgi:hypothetical protein
MNIIQNPYTNIDLQARIAYNAGMQYTIRDIPRELDEALRHASKRFHKSLNQVTLEALLKGANLEGKPQKYHDLDTCCGSWMEDPEFDKSLKAQRQIDEDRWK